MAYLYHIKLPGMTLNEGYIGISKCYETRWKQHEHAAHNLNSPYVVHQNMRRYIGEYEKVVVAEGSVQEVLDQEYALRPNWMMAWNMAQGGGAAGSGWVQPDSWISNELWHPDHGEIKITKDFTATDFARKIYNGHSDHKSKRAILYILRGLRYDYDRWQLRDAQLAKQVKTWLETPWTHAYLSNGEENIVVYHKKHSEFSKHIGTTNNNAVRELVKGIKKFMGGYYLITEKEYNSNPGRVFGERQDNETGI